MVLALLKRGKLLRGPQLQVFYHGNDRQDTAGTKASQISVSGKGVNIHTYVQTTTHTHKHKNKTASKARCSCTLGYMCKAILEIRLRWKRTEMLKGQHTQNKHMANNDQKCSWPVLPLTTQTKQCNHNYTQKNGDAHSRSYRGMSGQCNFASSRKVCSHGSHTLISSLHNAVITST